MRPPRRGPWRGNAVFPAGVACSGVCTGSSLQSFALGVDTEIVMVQAQMTRDMNDDPRKLSQMIARVSELAVDHAVCSVVVGVAAEEGDLLFPDYLSYLELSLIHI